MYWEGVELPPEITEETTLDDILDDDYILQRCRERNANLIEFLLLPERINALIDLITDQSNLIFDQTRFKRPSVAAEILSSDIPQLLDLLVSPAAQDDNGVEILPFVDNLLSFIDSPLPLNPLSASFFSKILTNLLLHRATELVPYLQKKSNFFPNLLQHIEASAVGDLLVELAQQDNGQQHLVAKWILDSNLISQLLNQLSDNSPDERQENSARCLIEFFSTYRNYIADPSTDSPTENSFLCDFINTDSKHEMFDAAVKILDHLESEQTLATLLDLIINNATGNSNIITNASEVFLTAIDKAKSLGGLPPGAGDEFKDAQFESLASSLFYTSMAEHSFSSRLATSANSAILQKRLCNTEINAVNAVIPRLPLLYTSLQHGLIPQNYREMKTTAGLLSPPLGRGRLAIVNLISSFSEINNFQLRKQIYACGFIPLFMKFFEEYPRNSFLHKAVVNIFKQLLSTTVQVTKEDQEEDDKTPGFEVSDAFDDAPVDKESQIPKNIDKPHLDHTYADSPYDNLFFDFHIIEWILRLSCIPSPRQTTEDRSDACRLSTVLPKPGYSGHLWQLSGLISTRFPAGDSSFLEGKSNGLTGRVSSRWNEFVQGDLAAIMQIQNVKPDIDTNKFMDSGNITLASLQLKPNKSLQEVIEMMKNRCTSGFSAISAGCNFTNSNGPSFGFLGFPNSQVAVRDDDDDDDILDDIEEDDTEEVNPKRTTSCYNNSSSSSSDDEEDLVSPASIRQQRTTSSADVVVGLGHCNRLLVDGTERLNDSSQLQPSGFPLDVSSAHSSNNNLPGGDESWANFDDMPSAAVTIPVKFSNLADVCVAPEKIVCQENSDQPTI